MNEDWYAGREQTFLKHFVLSRYLQIVAIKIGMTHREFVYVDGFSGPWESQSPDLKDTSFMIALGILSGVREIVGSHGRSCKIRCMFIEKNPEAFEKLRDAVSSSPRIIVEARQGEFENLVPQIVDFVGSSFGFVFIDPTSWQGIGLKNISPILRCRGEVLINFMYDFVQRFLEVENLKISKQMDELMGGDGWYDAYKALRNAGWKREEAIIEVYRTRVKRVGGFKYVSYIRVMKPHSDRSYFYLVYGTDELAGIQAFSNVEKKFVGEQQTTRTKAKDSRKQGLSQMESLFSLDQLPPDRAWHQEDRTQAVAFADVEIPRILSEAGEMTFGELLGKIIERSFIWESDVKRIIRDLKKAGKIEIFGMNNGQRVPVPSNTIRWN